LDGLFHYKGKAMKNRITVMLCMLTITLVCMVRAAAATVIYDIRMNSADGFFFGDLEFFEPAFLTTLTTITTFDKNTLTAGGSPAELVVLSPIVGGPECVLTSSGGGIGVIVSASPGCFGIRFSNQPASIAMTGMLDSFTSVGVYGGPQPFGPFFLTIRQVPEPTTLLLLVVGIAACGLLRRRSTS
jgi:hypothetical protein